jgi:23S rRNA pseudouridine1911/1915/1917 synthase
MPAIEFVVEFRENGRTLAAVLKKRYGISWSQAKRLVERRHVRVGQQVETDAARRLKVGKKVVLDAGTIERKGPKPPTSAKKTDGRDTKRGAGERPKKKADTREHVPVPGIEIVYSDDAVVVANKPAGLTTMRHKEEAEEFGARGKHYLPTTLADLLPGLLGVPDRRVLAVHRIDRDTSGLVVFARTATAAEHLTQQFRKHTVERRYIALTRGTPPNRRINSVLVPDRGDGRRGTTRKSHPADGKRAVTHVRVVEVLGEFAAVECRLETGRTHQVRIHLGEVGTPLCGERVYDRPVNRKPFPDGSGAARPMLHAARLGFVHPDNGEAIAWEVKPPEDFARVWAELRTRAAGSR